MKNSKVMAIVGANWGDEGKGKITDICAANADIVARFQGGSNAGHTIINKYGEFALHQLPSGIFNENVINVIGNGVALNMEYLEQEMNNVLKILPNLHINLKISDRVQVLLPHHVLLDRLEEERRGNRKFGSTKSGIAPFYSEKYAKEGIQLNEIYNDSHLKYRLLHLYEKVNLILKHLYNAPEINYIDVYDKLKYFSEKIEKYKDDTGYFMRKAWKNGKNILLEGQLGALRDPDFGIYPYVTSSNTIAGFSAVGLGLPPYAITNVLAVTKAYSSSVGAGSFVTELDGEEAELLRNKGGHSGEYGATTGRPRRVGYFDVVATKYGTEVQGATEIALTGLDTLSYLDEIPVCVAYEINGERTHKFEANYLLEKAKPIFEKLPGFKKDIRDIRTFGKLPKEAQNYIKYLEEKIGVSITFVSNGPEREQMVDMNS
ncbi:MAG: adenylosuccinate synthase [Defluviitaleaceae bacterium]|nr:adenylosuccinate synthase [Defluviitaleaceae bacterium]